MSARSYPLSLAVIGNLWQFKLIERGKLYH